MSPNDVKQRLGRWGEDTAAQYLETQGYHVLGRNLRTPYGEIDLLCEKEGTLVFVEVKTRSGTGYGLPEEAITKTKRKHLLAAISYYWQQVEQPERDWRVDVIAIIRRTGGKEVEVEHFENAIT